MDSHRLAKILNKMYFDADEGHQVAMIHLFGIKYSEEIRSCEDSPKEIAKKAKISETYGTEINKGCKLARFVDVKDSIGLLPG